MTGASSDGFFPLKTGCGAGRQEGPAERRSAGLFCASYAPNLRQCRAGSARKTRETPGQAK